MKNDPTGTSANNQVKTIMFAVVIIWGTLAIVFAGTDLQISLTVVNVQSRWANILAEWGQYPGLLTLVGAVFLAVIHRVRRKKNSVSPQLMLFANVTIGSAFLSFGVLHLLKTLWGRVRFYDLDALYSQYTPWYVPQGLTGNESFPSGHTTLGWWCLPLVILVLTSHRGLQILMLALTLSWGTLVAISRVRVGAHYASDVLFSSGLVIVTVLLLYQHFSSSVNRKGEKYSNSQYQA